MNAYLPENWYWVVAGSVTHVYSSLVGDYVAVDDPTYLEWLVAGNSPTEVASEEDLGNILAQYDVPTPVPAGILNGSKSRQVELLSKLVVLKALYHHENRIRQLEGQSTLTVPQFLDRLKSLL